MLSDPLIEYQIIEQRGPKVTTLHREKVNIIEIETISQLNEHFFHNRLFFQQIYDYYNWLKDKSERNDILEVEGETMLKYLELNSQKNDWPKIRKIFHNPIDYEFYSNVQYVNDYICYSYMDFSKSIYKP